jgi:hypothetical protein
MKATVRKELCPECEVPAKAWVVRGNDGTCWTCTHDWNAALRYAIERIEQGKS